MKSPILGASYVTRSPNVADNRMINLFPEVVPDGGKEAAFLSRAPGLRLLASVGAGPIRGLWKFGGNGYVVSGNELYKINSSYVSTLLGTVGGATKVSMADNGTQLFLAVGAGTAGYIYDSSNNTLARIEDPDFSGAVTVGYLDGYFVFNPPNSQQIWITSLLDGNNIDALDFASAEGSPDEIVGLIVDHREVWVFGVDTVEVFYNAGTPDFPLERVQGAFSEIGCVAAHSIAKADNGIFWLGGDTRGKGIVYRANGYTGQRISTHSIEWQIQSYGDISDAIGYTYQQDGHTFYVLTFPSAGKTWVYDMVTEAWHERAGFSNGEFTRHRSNCQMMFNDENVVGDYQNGNLYAFDMTVYSDNGSIQKWLRSWRALPTGQGSFKRMSHHSLQLDIQSGVGLTTGQGEDPQVMLRWSDDSGHTWSNIHYKSLGRLGDYGKHVTWRRLGMTDKLRDRVYEVSGTDPTMVVIQGAELIMSATNA